MGGKPSARRKSLGFSSETDPFAAIERRVGWDKFVRSVVDAESLAQPETTDNRAELIKRYGSIRTFAPALLETFEFRGGGAVNGLLRAITVIRDMYRGGKRTPAPLQRMAAEQFAEARAA